jgi:hypothetical protein
MSDDIKPEPAPVAPQEEKVDEVHYDKIQDYQTILEKINLQTVPISATMYV